MGIFSNFENIASVAVFSAYSAKWPTVKGLLVCAKCTYLRRADRNVFHYSRNRGVKYSNVVVFFFYNSTWYSQDTWSTSNPQ